MDVLCVGPKMMGWSGALLAIPGILMLGLAVHRATLPYNEDGRYFDATEGVVYRTEAVLAYGLIAFLILSISIGLWFFGSIRARKRFPH